MSRENRALAAMSAGRKSARREDIDFFRFFAILLMIAGHVGFGRTFDKYIHAFHMPLWFILSGYFCNVSRPFRKTLFLRVKKLLVPYLCFSLLYEFLKVAQGGRRWRGMLYPNSVQVPFNGALWFLPALFIADITATFLFRYLPDYLSASVIIILSVIGCHMKMHLPLSLDSALAGIGFFGIGYAIRRLEKYLTKTWKYFSTEPNLVLDILLLRVVSLSIQHNGYINMRSRKYGIHALFWINAVAATLIFWSLCRWAVEYMRIPLRRYCLEAGSESLIYVCTNQFVLYVLNKFVKPEGMSPVEILIRIALVALIGIICFFLNRLLKKTPLKFMLGDF